MVDPFSNDKRSYIPWPEYLELQKSLEGSSLIDREDTPKEPEVLHRINELETVEAEKGFVFFGEAQWLKCKVNQNVNYREWVRAKISEIFQQGFTFENAGDEDDVGWYSSTEKVNFIKPFKELRRIPVYNLDVQICCGANEIPNEIWKTMFHILHNLPWLIDLCCKSYSDSCLASYEALDIQFDPQQNQYTIFFVSAYSSGSYSVFEDWKVVSS